MDWPLLWQRYCQICPLHQHIWRPWPVVFSTLTKTQKLDRSINDGNNMGVFIKECHVHFALWRSCCVLSLILLWNSCSCLVATDATPASVVPWCFLGSDNTRDRDFDRSGGRLWREILVPLWRGYSGRLWRETLAGLTHSCKCLVCAIVWFVIVPAHPPILPL